MHLIVKASVAVAALMLSSGCVPHYNDPAAGFFVIRDGEHILFGRVGPSCTFADARIGIESLEVVLEGKTVWALEASSASSTAPPAIELGETPDGYVETARSQELIDRITAPGFVGTLGISQDLASGRDDSGSVSLRHLDEAGPTQGVLNSPIVDRGRLICE